MSKMGIYKISNTIDGKFYIGSSSTLSKRLASHMSALRKNAHCNQRLQRAWNKHGKEAFVFEVVELVKKRDDLLDIEQHWLDTTRSYDDKVGYNIARFTDSNLRRMSNEDIIKIAELHRKGVHYKEIARLTGVSIATIHEIKNGSIYRDITGLDVVEYKLSELTEKEVIEIADITKAHKKKGRLLSEILDDISEKYNITHDAIYNIASGKTWSKVTNIYNSTRFTQRTKREVGDMWSDIQAGLDESTICLKHNTNKRYIGRLKRGELHTDVTGVKPEPIYLTEDKVVEIFKRANNGEKQADLAEEYGIHKASVGRIKNRKTWNEVTKNL